MKPAHKPHANYTILYEVYVPCSPTEKTAKALKDLEAYGEAWRVHCALFAWRGFTAAARAYAEEWRILLVN